MGYNGHKYIATTTINMPTPATLKFLQMKDWTMIIVGDLKTPHEEYFKLQKAHSNLIYIHPDEQDSKYKVLSDAIGWNKIMRRNIGYCRAYELGAELIASIDDDNIPYSNWGKNIFVGETIDVDCYESENGVFDPLSITNHNYLWHRGYPCELISTRLDVKYMGKIPRKALVQADLWDGVPDIDAMNRIIYNPRIKLNIDQPFCSTDIAPFNSQNTFIAREALPYYMVIPHIGRMDDIWGAYILQKQFESSVIFNVATVYQERHEPHTRNMKDMKDEIFGYEHTMPFLKGEIGLPVPAQKAYDAYRNFFSQFGE